MRPSSSPAKAALIKILFVDSEGERTFREGQRWKDDESSAEDEQSEEEGEEDELERKRTMDAFSEVFVATFHLFDKGISCYQPTFFSLSMNYFANSFVQSGRQPTHTTWTFQKLLHQPRFLRFLADLSSSATLIYPFARQNWNCFCSTTKG